MTTGRWRLAILMVAGAVAASPVHARDTAKVTLSSTGGGRVGGPLLHRRAAAGSVVRGQLQERIFHCLAGCTTTYRARFCQFDLGRCLDACPP